jgi:hypothetical protein
MGWLAIAGIVVGVFLGMAAAVAIALLIFDENPVI